MTALRRHMCTGAPAKLLQEVMQSRENTAADNSAAAAAAASCDGHIRTLLATGLGVWPGHTAVALVTQVNNATKRMVRAR